jgi:hypothetical protein
MNDDRGPAGDHFDGRRGDWLRWMAARKPVSWTPVTGFTPPSPPPARSDRLAIIWINHPTVLIQVADHNIILPPSNSPTKPGSPRPAADAAGLEAGAFRTPAFGERFVFD